MNFQKILDQGQDMAFGFKASAAVDKFSVVSFDGHDALFDGFEIKVELCSFDADIDLDAIVDTEACLTIHDKYDQPRHFHGVIAEAEAGDTGFSRSFYSVTLKPALHRLNYISDSRIFQDQSVQDIVSTILQDNNIPDVEWRVGEGHQPREFCVQYNETSYDFIRRMLAEEGLFFWFEHSASNHKMIISDAPWSMPILEHAATIPYNVMTGGQSRTSYISAFKQSQRVRATDLHQKDYSFKRPAYGQDQNHGQHESAGEKAQYALYDFPGRYKDEGAGKPFTKYKMEAARVASNNGSGKTQNIHLCSGFCFNIEEHPSDKANTMHRLLEVKHSGTQYAALEEDAPEGVDSATRYDASFTTMPQRIPYRPTNPNPKPQILGSQIATVTGPAGEEIYCDEHGRVKLKFAWDRHNKDDENSSCWVRVMHNSSGMRYGHASIPRIGSAVVVEFLEGDPDQPMVLGMAYDPTAKHAYDLPANKTRAYWKDTTHKGDGYNEIRFESEKGKEEIFVHAQKDRNEKIENNHTERVDANLAQSVNKNKLIEIGGHHHEAVGGSLSLHVGPSSEGTVIPKKHASSKTGMPDLFDDLSGGIGKNLGHPGNFQIQIDNSKIETISNTNTLSVGQSSSTTIGKNCNIGVGDTLTISAGSEINLVCGSSAIKLTRDGSIYVNGNKVEVVGSKRVNLYSDIVEIN